MTEGNKNRDKDNKRKNILQVTVSNVWSHNWSTLANSHKMTSAWEQEYRLFYVSTK
jgi:hypothetical protein